MNIEYKRDLHRNYIAIEAEEAFFDYQVQMITRNKIEGLLPCVQERVDNKVKFLYEINSRQPFSRVFEKNKLDYQCFYALMHCLQKAVDNAGEYLLDINSLLLDMDYIFMNPETKEIELIYLPGFWEDIKLSFHELAKQLLNWIDYKEERVVVAAYGLFKQTAEENYTLEQILKNISRKDKHEQLVNKQEEMIPSDTAYKQPAIEMLSEKQEKVVFNEENMTDNKSQNLFDLNFSLEQDLEEEREKNEKSKFSVLQEAGDLIKKFSPFKRKAEYTYAEDAYGDEFEEEKPYIEENENQQRNKAIYPMRQEEYLMSGISGNNMQIAEECEYGNTTFFQSKERENGKRLVSVSHQHQTFELSIYPFIIGKLEEATDGIVEDNSVSRIHAKIEKREGQFWLIDLNSTNGTFINGKMLAPNEKTKLQTGDKVQFGFVEYLFE